MYGYESINLYLWRSGDNLKELFLSFQGVRCRHEAQIIRLETSAFSHYTVSLALYANL